MAIFYYPNRGAPTDTLTISYLETKPKPRIVEKFQSRDTTPGGTAIVYNLMSNEVQYITLMIRNLDSSDKSSLQTFIETTVGWASNTFDFDDDAGTQYNTVRFWFDNHDFRRPLGIDLFNEDLLLRVDP